MDLVLSLLLLLLLLFIRGCTIHVLEVYVLEGTQMLFPNVLSEYMYVCSNPIYVLFVRLPKH